VERFFEETLGVSYDALAWAVMARWKYADGPPLADVERRLIKVRVCAGFRWFLIFDYYFSRSLSLYISGHFG
jgi:hypothetical protein